MKHARYLGAGASLGLTFFLAVMLILQFVRTDYDWIGTPLSFYLLGPWSGWLIAAYFTLAAGIACVGAGLYLALSPASRSSAPLLLFAVGAVNVVLVALAHTDTAKGTHPTVHGIVHNLAAALAFLCVTVAMLIQSWRFRFEPAWRGRFRTAFPLAVATFAALWTYALWGALPRGAAQKCVILLIVLWLLMASRWLMRHRSVRSV